ncbi:hypothetical protein Syun_026283 [Stephania yunnanensis]|uniref:non-specific serine/threonine protein kinase n=1 Tax=Stephania yunnanensis TaxID=152371 RepID=A0AAP0HS15_9MAGN
MTFKASSSVWSLFAVVVLVVLLCESSGYAAAADISLGSFLQPSPPANWSSPNNTFSLSFLPTTTTTTPTAFTAAISFSGIPVWKAGGDSALVDSNGRLRLLPDGDLRLLNGSGATVWSSNTSNRGVTSASLDDSGDLRLLNGTLIVWSSFTNPTDTILPSQNFSTNNLLRSGPYSFALLNSGNLTLRWNANTIYWNQGLNSTFNRNSSSPSLALQSIGILQLFDPSFAVPVVMAYSSDYGEGSDILRFLRLDSDGNLRIYSSVRDSGVATERWAAVADQCRVYGWCGDMGICSYNDSMPVCGCPSENFEFSDPGDPRKGCRRKVKLEDCPSTAAMLQLNHTQFLTFQPELSSQVFFVGISACRLNCLVGGSCMASTSLSDGTGLCYLKVSSFVSGYQSPALPSTSFVKVCGPVLPNRADSAVGEAQGKTFKLRAWVVVVVVLCTLVGLVLLEGGLWLWCCKNSRKFGRLSSNYALLEYASGAPVSEETGRKKFSMWAYEEYEKGNIGNVIDKRLTERDVDMEQAMRLIMVSFWCIQEQPSQRPTMGKVVQMLEGIMTIEAPPIPKASIESSVGSASSGHNSIGISAISSVATSAAPQPSSFASPHVQGAGFEGSSSSSVSNIKATSSLLSVDGI